MSRVQTFCLARGPFGMWVLLSGIMAVTACGGGDGASCRTRTECATGYVCAGANDRRVCGIPPREACADNTRCGGEICHAISDPCSPDGIGSECRAACTAISCGPGFRCNVQTSCEPIPCDEGATCPSHQRCDLAVAHAAGPVHARASGCVDIACTSDASCPAGTWCVNLRCQDGLGSCRKDEPVP